MRSGRRPNPGGTRFLFASTISLMSSWWANRGTTQKYQTNEKKRADEELKTKRAVLCPIIVT